MDIQSEKLELMRLLIETESEEIIFDLKAVFEKKGYDFWSGLPDTIKDSIEKGLNDVSQGNIHSHQSVLNEVKLKYGFRD